MRYRSLAIMAGFSLTLMGCFGSAKEYDLSSFGGGDPRPGQLVVVMEDAQKRLYHIPAKPFRFYVGLDDNRPPAENYEQAIVYIVNLTQQEFKLVCVETKPDSNHVITPLFTDGGALTSNNMCTLTLTVNKEAAKGALTPFRSTYRRYEYEFDIVLFDLKNPANKLHTIDPELIVEGRP